MNPDTTLVDILRKGNQELFHSAILAWLLHPEERHGLGPHVLRGISELLESKGHPELLTQLEQDRTPDVATEVSGALGRHDITLAFDSFEVVFENKTKSVGKQAQLDRYADTADLVVPVGLTRASFEEGTSPLITYSDILAILEEAEPGESDFGTLVRHYTQFLRRELGLLDRARRCYDDGELELHPKIASYASDWRHFTTNDARFVNLCLLEWFRRTRLNSSPWSGLGWRSNKNQSSGVWLAAGRSTPGQEWLTGLLDSESQFWLHIELKKGAFASSLDEKAGELQVRAGTDGSNQQLLESFTEEYTLGEGERFPARKPAETYNSFFLVMTPFTKRQLRFDALESKLRIFGEKFFEV